MAINKDYVKKKVAQAIKQMPSVGIVVREKYSKYKELESYSKICEIEGVLYSDESNTKSTIELTNNGLELPKSYKNFIAVYNEKTAAIEQKDYIFIDDICYKVIDPGENMKIYCLMKLEKQDGMSIKDLIITKNNSEYEVV